MNHFGIIIFNVQVYNMVDIIYNMIFCIQRTFFLKIDQNVISLSSYESFLICLYLTLYLYVIFVHCCSGKSISGLSGKLTIAQAARIKVLQHK